MNTTSTMNSMNLTHTVSTLHALNTSGKCRIERNGRGAIFAPPAMLRRLAGGLLLAAGLATLGAAPAMAREHPHGHGRPHEVVRNDAYYGSSHWRLDARYQHNHFYPARGYAVLGLPPNHLALRHHGVSFYYSSGVWFRPQGTRYTVVAPPLGIIVPLLPPTYNIVQYRGIPYYYANDVYYVQTSGGYLVSAPPPGEVVVQTVQTVQSVESVQSVSNLPVGTSLTGVTERIIMYPRNNQGSEQQANDRDDCRRWAMAQDRPINGWNGNTPPGPNDLQSPDYQRALAACLDGRGYSVR